MSNRRLGRSIFRACIALLAGAWLASGSDPGTFDRTLQVSGPVDLDVRSDPGGVTITKGSSTSVRVRAVIKPLYGRLDLDLAEANIRALERNPPIEQEGNRIRVGYVKDQGLLRAVTIHFDIETSGSTTVQARTTSGGISIDGITGPIEASTTSGRIDLTDVSVEIRATTHSGSIRIDNARGAVVARNDSGSIVALQLGSSVHAETKSGAIRISQLSAAPIRAFTESGAIKVKLASGGGYLIDAQSRSGKVSGPAASKSSRAKDGRSLKAQIGAGGPLVDLDTHSSRIGID